MPTDKSQSMSVTGLTEFRKELAKLDEKTFTNELKDAHAKVAELVVDKAKGRADLPVQRKASESLKASRAASAAQVTIGGPNFPFALGAEFGSNKYRQFPAHLGRTGYFLYPTIRDEGAEIERVYMDAIEKITSKAFPD